MKRNWALPCLPILASTVVCVFVKWDSAFKLLSQIPVIGLIVGQNFQPSDYKNPRLDIPLSIGEKNVRFSCKYRGRHEIDIVGCNVNPWEQSMLGLRMAVTDVKGTSLYHTVRSNEVALLTFDENGRRYMRFCYAVLDIPEDLPADTPLFLFLLRKLRGVSTEKPGRKACLAQIYRQMTRMSEFRPRELPCNVCLCTRP